MRVWHLAVIQYEDRLASSRRPQQKSFIEPAVRATIRDRFFLPLALNRVRYQAALLYSEIREIPLVAWEEGPQGKKIRVSKRKEYISRLSSLLAEELNLDPLRVEDLIYSKVSFYAHLPFVLKEEISEKTYYRLKMLEREWPGICARRLPKRYYPRGRTAGEIIGYMGAINAHEYEKIPQEIRALEESIREYEEQPDSSDLDMADVRKRLRHLKEKAYSIHDLIGKAGIEGAFEEQLRGFYGKKNYILNSKGKILRELSGSRKALSGHQVVLSLSADLQEFAEQLLAQNEVLRIVRKAALGPVKNTVIAQKHPWIKGGACIAMDPQTGEILALASYPRMDPNDFVSSGDEETERGKQGRIGRWFENEKYLGDIWNQNCCLERERYDPFLGGFSDEKKKLTWKYYLDLVLPPQSALRKSLDEVRHLEDAIFIQSAVGELQNLFSDFDIYAIFNFLYIKGRHRTFGMTLSGEELKKAAALFDANRARIEMIQMSLEPYFFDLDQNYDKVLLVDLCRVAVDGDRFCSSLIQQVGGQTLEQYRDLSACCVQVQEFLKKQSQDLFHDLDFVAWRKKNEKSYLKAKREEEKVLKMYPKPYLDYLDQLERDLFKTFWAECKWKIFTAFLTGKELPDESEKIIPYLAYFKNWRQELMQGADQRAYWREPYNRLSSVLASLSVESAIAFLKTMRSYRELNRPLLGRYRYLRGAPPRLEKQLAAAFYPAYGYGYGRSHGFRQATTQGSLFKLVTGYAALTQKFKMSGEKAATFHDLNPLTMIDQVYSQGGTRYVGYTEQGLPIPQLYKGGRLPRSLAHRNSGRVDLIRALEVSSNPYFSLLAGEFLEKPEDLAEAARLFSYGEKTGIELSGEISGKVPQDLATNRTGLYAMAIGQHSLVVTPLQTAVMLAAIANQGKILKPTIVRAIIGMEPAGGEKLISRPPQFPLQGSLGLVGIDFPLFTALSQPQEEPAVTQQTASLKRTIFMPELVRDVLLQGLKASILRTYQESFASLIQLYKQQPEAVADFASLKNQLAGKTSTAESVENLDLDLEEGTAIYTHVWFGCISFDQKSPQKGKNLFIFKDSFGEPELVVVVYLRYGGYGKEAAPLAAQIVKKWRSIKNSHRNVTK